MNVYTYTLTSDYVLVVDPQVAFGEIFIAVAMLILLALLVPEILQMVIYEYNRRNRPTD